MEQQIVHQAAPFVVNASNGSWEPGRDGLINTLSPSSMQAFMVSGMNPHALRPWVNMTPDQARVRANLLDMAMMAGDAGINVDQFFANVDAYITINGKNIKVNAGTLLKDEYKYYDDVVLQVAQERLVGVGDLLARGCVLNIPNAMGTTVLEYEKVSWAGSAVMSMDALTRQLADRPYYTIHYLPLPIIHDDFFFTIRDLTASRKRGTPLDTLRAAMATRNVAEYIETMLFTGPGGSTFAYGGGTIYGYLNQSGRLTYTTLADWGSSGITGAEVIKDVLNMKQTLIAYKHYGPYMLYVPTDFETVLDDDFKANSDKSVRQRIMEIGGIEGIKVADKLTNDNVVMVELKPETVRMVVGFQPMMVEWQSQGGMQFEFKVMAIMVPQIRADIDGNIGLVHGSTS
jgi:uncharacterized linocin/CFP29 family protein